MEGLAPLLDAEWVLVALLAEVVRVLRGRSEELVLVVDFLAVANRVDRVLWAMKLHLDAVWAGLGGAETDEAEASNVARILSNTVLLINIDPVLHGSSIADA